MQALKMYGYMKNVTLSVDCLTSSQEYSRASLQAMHLSAKKVGPGVDQ
jgi:hypothetical protein